MNSSNDPLIAHWKSATQFEAVRQQQHVLRDGRTLLPTTPAEIAASLNTPKRRSFVEWLNDTSHDLHLAYLRWEAGRLRDALECIPLERRAHIAAEERRHKTRLVLIANEAARLRLDAEHRLQEINMQIENMEGGAQ
jgi:hypothetical protein